ncbi:MAG: bifunctional oligoribonuclease/PAP phosphatase NrnA [Candidatus Thorarchaeota archaeon]
MNLRSLLSVSTKPLILGHQNADPDAICAMLAIKALCLNLNPNGVPSLVCDDVSRLSNQVLDMFNVTTNISNFSEDDHDLVFLLDTNSSYQLGPRVKSLLRDPSRTIVIDHHEENPEIPSIAQYEIVDSKASSTCELVIDLFEDFSVAIEPSIANLLLTGLLFDTRRFFHMGRNALESAQRLLEAGADYDMCIRALIIKPDRSERIARLKAAGRLKIHTVGDWVIASSKIGAYEASACRALIELGADVAIVAGKTSKGVVRFSSRSTRQFSSETGVNLGTDVMEPIGNLIGGEGGGHMNAAGANGTKNREEALQKSIELLTLAIERSAERKLNET